MIVEAFNSLESSDVRAELSIFSSIRGFIAAIRNMPRFKYLIEAAAIDADSAAMLANRTHDLIKESVENQTERFPQDMAIAIYMLAVSDAGIPRFHELASFATQSQSLWWARQVVDALNQCESRQRFRVAYVGGLGTNLLTGTIGSGIYKELESLFDDPVSIFNSDLVLHRGGVGLSRYSATDGKHRKRITIDAALIDGDSADTMNSDIDVLEVVAC